VKKTLQINIAVNDVYDTSLS